MTVSVFILDDHEVLRAGIRSLLQSEPDLDVVGEAGTVADALEQIPRLRPDIAILDVRLPDGSGVEACRVIRDRMPGVACLVLTSFTDDQTLFSAVLAGASGLVLKQIDVGALIRSIRIVATGQSLFDSGLIDRARKDARTAPKQDPRLASLTKAEKRVLDLVADGRSNRQIAAATHLSEKTVENYVSGVLGKLGMKSRTQAATYAIRNAEDADHAYPFEAPGA